MEMGTSSQDDLPSTKKLKCLVYFFMKSTTPVQLYLFDRYLKIFGRAGP